MNRIKLLEQLETVAPALCKRDTIPILTHLWFTGKQVLAFNDGIAISAALETEWSAAVPEVLIQLLRASGAGDVELILNKNGELRATAAAARIKLPTLPADFVFTMPLLKKDEAATIKGDNIAPFLDAVSFAVQCVAKEASVPEQLGVNLLPGASMWATNEKSLFYTKINTDEAIGKRVILSEEFCRQMLALRKRSETPTLTILEDAAIFRTGDVTLFGKLIHSEAPLDFEGVLKRHFPAKIKLLDIPAKMKPILERACIIISNGGDTDAEVRGNQIHFRSHDRQTDHVVSDVMKIDGEQSELTIKFNPSLAKLALDAGMNKIRLTKNCIIFTKDELVFLVTAKT